MIYIIQMEQSNYFKIGYTGNDDVYSRLASLQTACPGKLAVRKVIEDGDTEIERLLHRVFSDYQAGGGTEWFCLTMENLDWLLDGDDKEIIEKIKAKFSERNRTHLSEWKPIAGLATAEQFSRWMEIERIGDSDLARRMGVTSVYVWKLRHGKVEVSPSFAWKFAQVFGFDVARKLFDSEKEPT